MRSASLTWIVTPAISSALGVRWVVFSGGEPLMHSDLFRLSDRLRESGIRTTILTTGLLLREILQLDRQPA